MIVEKRGAWSSVRRRGRGMRGMGYVLEKEAMILGCEERGHQVLIYLFRLGFCCTSSTFVYVRMHKTHSKQLSRKAKRANRERCAFPTYGASCRESHRFETCRDVSPTRNKRLQSIRGKTETKNIGISVYCESDHSVTRVAEKHMSSYKTRTDFYRIPKKTYWMFTVRKWAWSEKVQRSWRWALLRISFGCECVSAAKFWALVYKRYLLHTSTASSSAGYRQELSNNNLWVELTMILGSRWPHWTCPSQ